MSPKEIVWSRAQEAEALLKSTIARRLPDQCGGNDFEDLVQEGLLQVLQYADRYDPQKGAFSTFVCTVGYHAAMNRLTANKRGKRGGDVQSVSLYTPLHDYTYDPGSRRTRILMDVIPDERNMLDRLTDQLDAQRMLETLSGRERYVMNLLYREGLTLKEAGAILGCSHTLVWMIRRAALDKMRRAARGQRNEQGKR